jgi:hypothetical protein
MIKRDLIEITVGNKTVRRKRKAKENIRLIGNNKNRHYLIGV